MAWARHRAGAEKTLRVVITLGLALAISTAPVVAAEPTPEDEKQFSELAKKDPKTFMQMVALAQLMLGAFGYGTGPFDGALDTKTRAALDRYQRARQLPRTGRLDARTFQQLNDDHNQYVRPALILPDKALLFSQWDRGYAGAHGTFLIVGAESGLPFQTTEIHCYKDSGMCVEAIALLDVSNKNFLSASAYIHHIERWDDHEIVTKPNATTLCVRYTLRLGRTAGSVTGLRLRVRGEKLCEGLADELRLELGNGRDSIRGVEAARQRMMESVIQAPGFRP